MARSVISEKQAKAAAARARMAKRSKRQRWIKENKKRILIICGAFLVVVFLAIFTPWGPEYYYNDIQMRKMDSSGVVSPGALKDLYSLAMFYQYSLREKAALEVHDEICTAYFGFKPSEYAISKEKALERRRQGLLNIKKGIGSGPPYTISDIDMPYVGYSIYQVGVILQKDKPKPFVFNVYNDLYNEDFKLDHPDVLDDKMTEDVQRFVDRFLKRR